MILHFFVLQLNGINAEALWFQNDETTCHTARDPITLLLETFDDRVILHNGHVISHYGLFYVGICGVASLRR